MTSEKESPIFMTIDISKDNDQGPLAMEQILSSIHCLNQKVSFEIWGKKGKIQLAIHAKKTVTQLFDSRYPGSTIQEKSDISNKLAEKRIFTAHLSLGAPPIFPIRRYSQTGDWIKKEWVNPYQSIIAPLRKIHNGERKGIQIIFSPLTSSWRKKGKDTLAIDEHVSSWWIFRRWWKLRDWFIEMIYHSWLLRMFFLLVIWIRRGEKQNKPVVRIDHRSHTRESLHEAVRAKLSQIGFKVTIRIIYSGSHEDADNALKEIAGGFFQFNIAEFNGFKLNAARSSKRVIKEVKHREFSETMILSVEELAGILTLPDKGVKIPELQRTSFNPLNNDGNSDKGVIIGKSAIGDEIIRLPTKSLGRHAIIWGRTGSGKTTFAFNLLRELIYQGKSIGVFDPHGDLSEKILDIIPKERIHDTVMIDPTDTDFPVAFNPFKISGRKDQVISVIVDSMRKIFEEFWGPRTDYILSRAVSVLIECPDESILGIPRLLLNENYRQKCLKRLDNPVLKEFWQHEYTSMPTRLRREAIDPILNKIGKFLMVSTMTNIFGQKENRIDFRSIMDSGKILLVKLAKGILGEENSTLLGSLLLAHLQLAILSRADIPNEKRSKFYLFVDEIQTLLAKSTNATETLLNESRKYGIGVIAACQNISQLGGMTDTVFGNVDTVISFVVGPTDAKIIAQYFQEISYEDLLNLPLYHAYIRMTVENKPKVVCLKNITPSSAVNTPSHKEKIIKYSQKTYARPRMEVEKEISRFFEHDFPIP